MGLFGRKTPRPAVTRTVDHEVRILFDIDQLGGGLYGQAAYRILFAALEPSRLAYCTFHDGDTDATIRGTRRLYCIAVRSTDARKIAYVRQAMAIRTDRGLLPLRDRFGESGVSAQGPLVAAGLVIDSGELLVRQDDMIQPHWAEGSNWRVVPR
ncbi:hypothetical protein [Streptomyces sp. CA2R106]|jgi:hypothetical protein|uniref:hypothetical protein n=1 Tax=Streptomyces sp. CA2R106 TaxID=3120153 RepID=UPI0030092AB2